MIQRKCLLNIIITMKKNNSISSAQEIINSNTHTDAEDESCQYICYERFNDADRLPKRLDCCKRIFCLKCLKEIYKNNAKKIICPNCRTVTKKDPKLLPNAGLFCPNCNSITSKKRLKIMMNRNGDVDIRCSACYGTKSSEKSFSIDEICGLIGKDFEGIDKLYGEYTDHKTFIQSIENHIQKIIYPLLYQFANELIAQLKIKITSSLSNERIISAFALTKEIISNFHKLKAMSTLPTIEGDDFPALIQSIKDCYRFQNSTCIEEIKSVGRIVAGVNGLILEKEMIKFNSDIPKVCKLLSKFVNTYSNEEIEDNTQSCENILNFVNNEHEILVQLEEIKKLKGRYNHVYESYSIVQKEKEVLLAKVRELTEAKMILLSVIQSTKNIQTHSGGNSIRVSLQ